MSCSGTLTGNGDYACHTQALTGDGDYACHTQAHCNWGWRLCMSRSGTLQLGMGTMHVTLGYTVTGNGDCTCPAQTWQNNAS